MIKVLAVSGSLIAQFGNMGLLRAVRSLAPASSGRLGTFHAQLNLREYFQFPGSYVISRPEVIIWNVAQVFDGDVLTDPGSREAFEGFVAVLEHWGNVLRMSCT